MALTIPDFAPNVACMVMVSILDASVQVNIPLSREQIDTLTDEELDQQIQTLIQALAPLCPGMDVQYIKLWSNSSSSGAWTTVNP